MADIGRGSLRIDPNNDYLAKLVKLIPAEVVALYVTFKEVTVTWTPIWALICLGLVIFVRCVGTCEIRKGEPKIQAFPVVVAAVSFIIWIYAIGGYLIKIEPMPDGVIPVAIGVWTFMVPYFYKPKDRRESGSEPAAV